MKPSISKMSFHALFFLVVMISCTGPVSEKPDPQLFADPPVEKKLHTWWHWLDGAISREGITKDLESMKEAGVCQATILNVGLFDGKEFGVPRVLFNSPEWYSMFQWALQEAKRLGIRIGVHNCDGWSSTGGPWITPEMSMKRYTWTKTVVTSGQNDPIKLSQPQANRNFYRDVAVIAVPYRGKLSGKPSIIPEITMNDSLPADFLRDGSPSTHMIIRDGDKMVFRYDGSKEVSRIALFPGRPFMWRNADDFTSQFLAEYSDDGVNYHKIIEFTVKGLNKQEEFRFNPVTARYFRLQVRELSRLDAWIPVELSEAEFLGESEEPLFSGEIPNLLEKSAAIKASSPGYFYTKAEEDEYPDIAEVLNLTPFMNSLGHLSWEVPEGTWAVYRIGYTSTGATNGPATAEGLGLECDKMDTAALNLHFRNFPAKLVETAGQYTGNTFGFVLIDSWECGYQNWTSSMPEEFLKRKGYDLIPLLPVLCGEVLGTPELSEAILYDFRATIAELIQENYYEHYRDLLHAQGLELHAEVIYGNAHYPPLDILKSTECVDLPMYEFWTGTHPVTNFLEYRNVDQPELHLPASAALFYDKPVIASEAYTGFAHYSESLQELKPYGDRAYCSGINQMILHSYVHQPSEAKPGMTLGQWASHFNRHNPVWTFASGWADYQGRIQYLLQMGQADPDVLYYLGDQLPQYYETGPSTRVPAGYGIVACNYDVLMNKIKVKDGKLVLPGKASFRLLSMPQNTRMNLATLRRIYELVKAGAWVYGPKPTEMLSRNDLENGMQEFKRMADDLWGPGNNHTEGSKKTGKGGVCYGPDLAFALKELDIPPDIDCPVAEPGDFLFTHRKTGETHIYFIVNQTDSMISRNFIFTAGKKNPEIWDPETGLVSEPLVLSYNPEGLILPLDFKPRQSLFVLLEKGEPSTYLIKVERNNELIFPDGHRDSLEIPVLRRKENGYEAGKRTEGTYRFTENSGKSFEMELAGCEIMEIPVRNIRVKFESSYPDLPRDTVLSELISLDRASKTELQYFSGFITYKLDFTAPEGLLDTDSRLYLDPGMFEATASIRLNGELLGNAWLPGIMYDVSGKLKAQNKLEVTLATTWRNRIIGDYREFGELRNISTSAPVSVFLDASKPLKPSGWMGPLRLVKEQPFPPGGNGKGAL